jgi:hypothetical protein
MIDFIPQNEGQLILWLGNFHAKISVLGPTLGYTAAQIPAISNACNALVSELQVVEAVKAALKNAVEAKDSVKLDRRCLLRVKVIKIKANDAYIDPMVNNLGIQASAINTDEEYYKSIFSGEALLRIGWRKHLYKTEGAKYLSLSFKGTNSPYDDRRP